MENNAYLCIIQPNFVQKNVDHVISDVNYRIIYDRTMKNESALHSINAPHNLIFLDKFLPLPF